MENKIHITNDLFENKGKLNLSVVMITFNEEHNIEKILSNLYGWAKEVIVLDSYSTDQTTEIAKRLGAKIFKKKFVSFGSQWNYAINNLPIKYNWTMKIDPDEFITDELKNNISKIINKTNISGIYIYRRLWFLNKPLAVKQKILRIWKTGECYFNNVKVNEYPIVNGNKITIKGDLHHFDSPNLEHWINKQNKYTSLESEISFEKLILAEKPKFFGNSLQRRMFYKKLFYFLPFRYVLFFIYNYFILGTWKNGFEGFIWSRLRSDVMRIVEYKTYELQILSKKNK